MNIIDISIIVTYLSLIFSIGIYTRNYIKDFSDFMIAGRKVNLALSVVTMLGTELGLITVMYTSQTGVNGLFASFHIGLAAFFVTMFISLSGFVVVKLRALKVKSIPEYYNLRFGKRVRVLGAIMLCLGGILNMGLFLKVGALFIQNIFGVEEGGITLMLIMLILLVLVLVYTVSGGMVSVIVTDYVQYVVLSIGLMISIYYSISYFGWSNLFSSLESLDKINSYDEIYNPIKKMGPAYMSWQIVLGFVSAVIWPTAITRALSVRNVSIVKKQYFWSSFSFLIRFIIPCFLGICSFIYFNGNVDNENSLILMPMFLSEILPHGLLGLVVAGMLAAFMSTHDSYLLCWSTIITNDIIEPLAKKEMSSALKIKITRFIIILLGAYIYYWGMFYEGSDAIWDYLGITGAIYFTGAISVIVFGLYWKKASSTGALLSLIGGLSSIVGLEPIRNYLQISVENPAIIGLSSLGFSIALMFFGSLIWPDKESKFHINSVKNIKTENLISTYLIFEILVVFTLLATYLFFGPQSSWFRTILSWKLIWQTVLISVIIIFFIMFLKFTVSGYKDLKEMLGFDND